MESLSVLMLHCWKYDCSSVVNFTYLCQIGMPSFIVTVIKTLGGTQLSYPFFSADREYEHEGPDQIVQRSTSS